MKKNPRAIKTNLNILAKGQDRPQTGDVFVFSPKGRDYYFGLVVNSHIRLVSYSGEVCDQGNRI